MEPALEPATPAAPGHEAVAGLNDGALHGPSEAGAQDGAAAAAACDEPSASGPALPPPAEPPVVEVVALDWQAVRAAVAPARLRARMRQIVEAMEALLDQPGGASLMFDRHRADPQDRVIRVPAVAAPGDAGSGAEAGPLWVIGDLHGDLLALEAALACIRADAGDGAGPPGIIFLGDFYDDEGYGLELLLRVFELILETPGRVCVLAGNHDEALSFDGSRFASSVSPSDFADFLNANRAHEWIERTAKLAVRLTARLPRALFLPDGLLIAHGGFPLSDRHEALAASGNWNDPACLTDFVWARAHPKARRKMPNRFSRGSQFGYEDFADFCALSARLGAPVTHMVRGHDHVEERYAVYPAYEAHPVVTTVALSRRLPREQFGPHERVPTLVRLRQGNLPQVHRLHLPGELVREFFPPAATGDPEAAP